MRRRRRPIRSSLLLLLCLITVQAAAQVRRPASASRPDGSFGQSFFDELRSLFGRLQQSDLDRAFERARAIRCSDLAGESGEWKQVAFLNDDRRLGDWHFDSIEQVKGDLTKFVFTGDCLEEQGPLTVATSYPIQESTARYTQGRISLSQVAMKDNAPVMARFDSAESTYVFEVPYVYLDTNKKGRDPLYTLSPPLMTSKTVPGLAIEFRCKTSGDNDPTYLFLMCRTHMVDHNIPASRRTTNQSLGNSAYYILSDGKEAHSTVKLVFGDVNGGAPDSAAKETAPHEKADSSAGWRPAVETARLQDVGDEEFRLAFDSNSWKDRIDKVQLLENQKLSAAAESGTPDRNKNSCFWRPTQTGQIRNVLNEEAANSVIYVLRFTRNSRSPLTAIFEVENETRQSMGSLQCYFPMRAAADITVGDWLSIVGPHVKILLRGQ